MKPKEKARELIEKFYRGSEIGVNAAKKCALICVKELIITAEKGYELNAEIEIPYFKKVITELKNL